MFVTQSIQRPHGVNVFGSCLIRAEPDYASLRFGVVAVAAQPGPAIEQAQAAARRVREVLAEAGVAERDVRSSRVGLGLAFEGYGADRREIGHRANLDFQVLVRDLGVVEPLLVRIVDAGAPMIDGVSYKTSRMKALREEARRGAVAAARAKAEVYARACGQEVGRALHIEDIDPDDLARRSHAPDVDLTEHAEDEGGAAEAGSIVIAGAVMICFALV